MVNFEVKINNKAKTLRAAGHIWGSAWPLGISKGRYVALFGSLLYFLPCHA